MLMLLGISPEMATAAYRVGDSATNIITPLMVYFPLILIFCQRWQNIRSGQFGRNYAALLTGSYDCRFSYDHRLGDLRPTFGAGSNVFLDAAPQA